MILDSLDEKKLFSFDSLGADFQKQLFSIFRRQKLASRFYCFYLITLQAVLVHMNLITYKYNIYIFFFNKKCEVKTEIQEYILQVFKYKEKREREWDIYSYSLVQYRMCYTIWVLTGVNNLNYIHPPPSFLPPPLPPSLFSLPPSSPSSPSSPPSYPLRPPIYV